MSRLQLTFACGDYDRTRAIEDGSVHVDGIDVTYLRLPVEETFFRMARYREFDIAEMSLSTYVASLNTLDRGERPPFVALPVYTSRQFRHAGMFINTEAGISSPSDLSGKRIGLPEMQLTACVWQRGILADGYGLPLDASTFYTGGQESPGRIEKAKVDLPFDIRPIPAGRTLSEMLAVGDLDAIFAPRIPSVFGTPGAPVARLFPDAQAAERQYFRDTGIFPIMHVVALRRELYESNRWIAQSLTKALNEAKDRAMERIYDASALHLMEPWLMLHLEEARALMGADYWSYGVDDGNRRVLETFLRYHHEQGLSGSLRSVEDLFAPEALESFVI
ncbi:ABC transporter substrate-binding protein [Microbacterium pseudoresistens]|uniref:4,5-dihydroxyphthalate decarboxylase n=1 Tax=Microbacterium pseudoresistens TaxID=640634 RepID=A0A7Y9EW19_9MICO|nr:ABC transporter substrate-binding protein [Microbacterium pseudoresistens]NYD54874.1 4,5-dihydroxyphthalate decarboxylase [Microbacterium pseudoresistens]